MPAKVAPGAHGFDDQQRLIQLHPRRLGKVCRRPLRLPRPFPHRRAESSDRRSWPGALPGRRAPPSRSARGPAGGGQYTQPRRTASRRANSPGCVSQVGSAQRDGDMAYPLPGFAASRFLRSVVATRCCGRARRGMPGAVASREALEAGFTCLTPPLIRSIVRPTDAPVRPIRSRMSQEVLYAQTTLTSSRPVPPTG